MLGCEVLLLFGTQTGNAEVLAEDLAVGLQEKGYNVDLMDMADVVPEDLAEAAYLIICTSTWGDGELPDNALDLYEGLDAIAPDLSHLYYGIVALGDHYYDPHYCAAARIFEEILERLGAVRAVDTYEINEGPTEEDTGDAMRWALQCIQAFEQVDARSMSVGG